MEPKEPAASAAPPAASGGEIAAEVVLAVPFDIDLELDFARLAKERARPDVVRALTGRNAPIVTSARSGLQVFLEGADLAVDAREEIWIYGFEVGLLLIQFGVKGDLARLADLACDTEKFEVEHRPIYVYADARAEEVRRNLRPFARQRYQTIYRERDVYPIVILPPRPDVSDASRFIVENQPQIVGIVGGEDDWSRLSPYALEKSELHNLGYYKEEVVIAKEWGALVSSAFEQPAAVGLILLAYAQRWALQSYNHLTNYRQDEALDLLAKAKEFKRFRFRPLFGGRDLRELGAALFEAHEDRIALAAAIRDFTSVPELTHDWHLHHLYQDLARTFYLNELYRVVSGKNEELERAYSTIHDHLVQSRLLTLELYMVVLFVLEALLLLVWFLSEGGHPL